MRNRAKNGERRISVCLVEHNVLAGCYLRGILEHDQCVEILSEGSTLKNPAACQILPSIFVIDADTLSSPLANYLRVLKSRFPEAKTLLLGEGLSADELRRLPFLEVQGFVSYNDVKDELSSALQVISKGDVWFDLDMLSELFTCSRSLRPAGQSETWGQEIFTPREKLIVGFVQKNLANKEIAAALKISQSTVKFHLSNIFQKLGVRDRRSAASVAASPKLTKVRLNG